MINFCTLFDSNYLDKAIALYNSLVQVNADFTLYVLCFDKKSYEILITMNLEHIKLEKLEYFETPQLLKIKETRSKAEYCWTCTAALIEYFIHKYNLSDCTYIDADLYFFTNPQILFDEIKDAKADIAIMEHRFSKKKNSAKDVVSTSGKYCVEFNYFNTSEEAEKALKWWKDSCFEWCYHKFEPATAEHPDRYGDQKYLEQFPILFKNVHTVEHLGGGVAPWNLRSYTLLNSSLKNSIVLKENISGKEVPLIFYHFQNLKYISHELININSQCSDKRLKYAIYYPYLLELERIRNMLKVKYGLEFGIRKSYSNNKIKAFIQRYIMPFRLHSFSDLVDIRKILR